MGFRNKILGVLFLVIGSLFEVNGQDYENIDLDFIYNEWALSESESYDDIFVYADEGDFMFDDVPYNVKFNLSFTSYDNTFYLKHFERKRPIRRCGNGPTNISHYKKSSWEKGVWKIEKEDEYIYLVLEHFNAEKGEKYKRIGILEYRILNLTANRMVLQKIR